VSVVPINHMEGHIIISMIDFPDRKRNSHILKNMRISGKLREIEYPILALLISGGHTELILMKDFGRYEYLGRTRDDAVGEAFDKVARFLDLPYPGGVHLSRLAEQARDERLTKSFMLPRPMIDDDTYDFSFAGLKTAVLRLIKSKWQGTTLPLEAKLQIAREFEDSVTEVLIAKTLRAVEEYGANAVVMGGGVSANKHIRAEFGSKLQATGCRLLVCPPEFSTDNGLMIALAGYFRALKNRFSEPDSLRANGTLALETT
jgi:N6-L-threonylcarbamoyladenine synthase